MNNYPACNDLNIFLVILKAPTKSTFENVVGLNCLLQIFA